MSCEPDHGGAVDQSCWTRVLDQRAGSESWIRVLDQSAAVDQRLRHAVQLRMHARWIAVMSLAVSESHQSTVSERRHRAKRVA